MKCRKCGAELLDTDTFCVKCGQRVEEPMLCPNCGEQLREGERFCHHCGTQVEAVEEDDAIPVSVQNTIDIPFDQIEQGILLEAERAVVKRPQTERTEQRELEREELERRELERRELERRELERKEFERKELERKELERRELEQRESERRRSERRESIYERDYDEGNEGGSGMKIIMTVMGIAIVAVALTIGYIFWQRMNPLGLLNGVQQEGGAEQANSDDTVGRIQILSNVNVRNKPTTDGSEVMMVAKTGETYEYYELVDESWYRIKLEDGREGYVSAKYVEDLQ